VSQGRMPSALRIMVQSPSSAIGYRFGDQEFKQYPAPLPPARTPPRPRFTTGAHRLQECTDIVNKTVQIRVGPGGNRCPRHVRRFSRDANQQQVSSLSVEMHRVQAVAYQGASVFPALSISTAKPAKWDDRRLRTGTTVLRHPQLTPDADRILLR
jgi:hypothetical protein